MEASKFEVRFVNEDKGKGLFAIHLFKEGEVIFEEEPLVASQFAWNEDYKYLACEYCLRPLESAEENARRLTNNYELMLPFSESCETKKHLITECEACGIKYCCLECQSKAWSRYHQTLCLQSKQKVDHHPLVQLKETWKQMQYPPETATIMLLARMVAMVNQAMDKSEILSTFSQFCHRTTNDIQEITHNLLGEKFIGQIDILRQMMEKALNTELVPEWFTPHGFQSLVALIGTNGQGIGTSPFSTWVKNVLNLDLPEQLKNDITKQIDHIYDDMDEVVGNFLDNEGSGLYVLHSSINHSCVPNAIVEFPHSNSTLVIKALQDILPDEEICIGYLSECNLERSRYSRQKMLKSLYLFNCQCPKCELQINDPNMTSDEDDADTS